MKESLDLQFGDCDGTFHELTNTTRAGYLKCMGCGLVIGGFLSVPGTHQLHMRNDPFDDEGVTWLKEDKDNSA